MKASYTIVLLPALLACSDAPTHGLGSGPDAARVAEEEAGFDAGVADAGPTHDSSETQRIDGDLLLRFSCNAVCFQAQLLCVETEDWDGGTGGSLQTHRRCITDGGCTTCSFVEGCRVAPGVSRECEGGPAGLIEYLCACRGEP